MKHLQSIKLVILSLIILVGFTSCTMDEIGGDGQKAAITVSLKSTNNEHNNVFLDIEDVEIRVIGNFSDDWLSLNAINTGTHNVSNLRSESELLLVDHFEIDPTFVHEIRLVLSDNNFIKVNNASVNLDVAENATTTNLIERLFESNHIYQIEINIDIDESIQFNDDTMVLNPKLYTEIRKI